MFVGQNVTTIRKSLINKFDSIQILKSNKNDSMLFLYYFINITNGYALRGL